MIGSMMDEDPNSSCDNLNDEEKDQVILCLIAAAKYYDDNNESEASFRLMCKAMELETSDLLLRTKITYQIGILLKSRDLKASLKFFNGTIDQVYALPQTFTNHEKNEVLFATYIEVVAIMNELGLHSDERSCIETAMNLSFQNDINYYYSFVLIYGKNLVYCGKADEALKLYQHTLTKFILPRNHVYARIMFEIELIKVYLLAGNLLKAQSVCHYLSERVNHLSSMNLLIWQLDVILLLLSCVNTFIALATGKDSDAEYFSKFISNMNLECLCKEINNVDSEVVEHNLIFSSVNQLRDLVVFVVDTVDSLRYSNYDKIQGNKLREFNFGPSKNIAIHGVNSIKYSQTVLLSIKSMQLLQYGSFLDAIFLAQKVGETFVKSCNLYQFYLPWYCLMMSALQCVAENYEEARKNWFRANEISSKYPTINSSLLNFALAIDFCSRLQSYNSLPVHSVFPIPLIIQKELEFKDLLVSSESKMLISLRSSFHCLIKGNFPVARQHLFDALRIAEEPELFHIKFHLFLLMLHLEWRFGNVLSALNIREAIPKYMSQCKFPYTRLMIDLENTKIISKIHHLDPSIVIPPQKLDEFHDNSIFSSIKIYTETLDSLQKSFSFPK